MSAYLQHRCQNDTVGKQPCPCKCSHQHGTGAGDHQRCGEIYQQIHQEMDHQQYQRLFHDGKAVISSGCPDAYRSKFHDHIWHQIIKNSQQYSVQKQCTSLYRKAVIEIHFSRGIQIPEAAYCCKTCGYRSHSCSHCEKVTAPQAGIQIGKLTLSITALIPFSHQHKFRYRKCQEKCNHGKCRDPPLSFRRRFHIFTGINF